MSIPDSMRELRRALQRFDDAPLYDGVLAHEVVRQARALVTDYDSWREHAEWARDSQLKLSPTPETLRDLHLEVSIAPGPQRGPQASLWLTYPGERDTHQGMDSLTSVGTPGGTNFLLVGHDDGEKVMQLDLDRERAEWLRDALADWLDGSALPAYIYADSHGHYYDARNGEAILIRDEVDLRRVEAAFEAQGGNDGIPAGWEEH